MENERILYGMACDEIGIARAIIAKSQLACTSRGRNGLFDLQKIEESPILEHYNK